jgi:hypothetical protein
MSKYAAETATPLGQRAHRANPQVIPRVRPRRQARLCRPDAAGGSVPRSDLRCVPALGAKPAQALITIAASHVALAVGVAGDLAVVLHWALEPGHEAVEVTSLPRYHLRDI